MRPRILAGICALCVTLLGFMASAQAEEVASCTIFEIEASSGDGGIDADLKVLEKKLKKPPFSAWKSFKVVKKHAVKATLMKSLSLKLVKGGALSILYRDRTDAKGSKPRLRLALTLDDKNGKRKAEMTIKIDSGDYTLLARGSDVFAVGCAVQ